MGQTITVEAKAWGNVGIFTGNRSITGQDGETYARPPGAGVNGGFGAVLARRLFDADPDVDHVFVHSNNVVVRRTRSWDETDIAAARDVIEGLFVHYGDDWEHEPPVGGEGAGLVVGHHAHPAVASPLDPVETDRLRAAHYNATITRLHRAHESLWVLDVTPDQPIEPYAAGQYATLGLGYWEPRIDEVREAIPDEQLRKLARRSYSISSSILDGAGNLLDPVARQAVEFYVVLVEKDWQEHPAVLTPRLFLKDVGDRIYLGRKIAGRYRVDRLPGPDTDVVMLATGTGEAPHNAMTLELLRKGHRGRIVSVCTVRYRRDLAYLDVHRSLEERFPNYRYHPMTTREPEDAGRKVYIQDLLTSGGLEDDLGGPLDPQQAHIFLCGNPAMIGLPEWDGDTPVFPEVTGVAELLVQRGFTIDRRGAPGSVHYEEYW